jgi:uncharacterized membrane protein YiaA
MKSLIETISTICIVSIAILFLNPTHLTMPDSFQTTLILSVIIAFLFFAAVLWREKPEDERDQSHIIHAGRLSYIIGVGLVVVGILLQAVKHEVDAWLVITLCDMVLSKFLSRLYFRLKM